MKKHLQISGLLMAFLFSFNLANAQFGCGSGVVITNGYSAVGITTPGTGGAEDWNDNPSSSCGAASSTSYWDDDVYLFEYTSGSTDEEITMVINSNNTWNGIGIWSDCTGTVFSGCLDAEGTSSAGTRDVTAVISANTTVYIAVGQWGTPNDLDFDVTSFTAVPLVNPPNCDATLTSSTTDFSISGVLTWSPATGAPTGYKISVGSTTGGTDIANEVDVMTATSYTPSGLAYSTTYYTTITPYNGNGDATSCTEESFVVEAAPPTGSICSDPLIIPATLPYSVTDNTGGYGDDYSTADNPCGGNYMNGDDVVYSYTPSADVNVDLVLTGTGTWVGLFVLEGCAPFTTCTGSNTNSSGNPSIAGLDLINGTEYFIVISTNPSPQATAYTLDITENSCSNPAATYTVVDDCAISGGFLIDVDITDIGSATSLTISDDQGSADQVFTGTETIQFGSYVNATDVVITVTNDQDATCVINSSALTQDGCPPANDECTNAGALIESTDDGCNNTVSGTTSFATKSTETTLCSTFSNNDDVWYTFTPSQTNTYFFNITNTTSTTYVNIYSGTCGGGLTSEGSSCFTASNTAVLTMGTTYLVQVYTSSSTSTIFSDFDLCVYSAPPPPANDECANAEALTVDVGGTCSTQTLGTNTSATDSGTSPSCAGTSYLDVWYSAVVPASGILTIETSTAGAWTDGGMAVWSDCGTTLIECDDDDGPGAFSLVIIDDVANSTSYAGTTVYINVWEYASNSFGEFNICARTPAQCPEPSGLAASNITESSADLGWTENGSSGLWNIEWGPTGFIQGSGTTVSGVTVNPHPLSGLDSDTPYDFYVQADCGASTSIWSDVNTFSTSPPPPANDNACSAAAIVVDAAPTTWTTTQSTGETSEPEGSCWFGTGTQESVWFTFVGPASGEVNVSTDFDTPLNDTHIAVYSGSSCTDFSDFVELGCSEDEGDAGANGYNSTVDVASLVDGVTYYVQVDGYLGADGEFMLEIKELVPPPANDDCADATEILDSGTTGSGSLSGESLVGATPSGLGADGCDSDNTATPADVWYKITTNGSGTLIVNVLPGATSDVVMALYNSCGDPVANAEGCGDTGGDGIMETINVVAALQNQKGTSTTRADEFFLRVYEKNPSGEEFTIQTQGSALPIELASFEATAEKRGNNVTWSTLSEINSDYVEVQSSPNGSTKWEIIGEVKMQGESYSRVDYDFFDNNPYAVTYYRLHSVDKDDRSEMSQSVNVIRNDRVGKMSLSPNPTSAAISLQTVSSVGMTGTIMIYDMTGKIMKNESINLNNGLNTISIDLDNLNAGIYLFSLQTEDGVQVEKIVKH